MKILIVEDEQDLRELIGLHLRKEGYEVFMASDGLEAIANFSLLKIDLVILDVMLPKLDGFSAALKIRESSNAPIIFLTALGDDRDKVFGLGLGADDYMVKPFSSTELVARVQAQLRRYKDYGTSLEKNEILHGRLKLSKDHFTLYKDGQSITLTAKEYKIMELFMDTPGRVYTKKQIYEFVWEDDFYSDDNTIMVHISYLRDKLEDDPKNPYFIKTIRGIGYKLEKG